MTTPFQPTLPVESVFTEAELNFIDDSPPGLYPDNQDSNYGLLRKILSDRVQELIDQQLYLYNERFIATSVDFIPDWEKEYGLPVAPTNRTLAQRRQDILARISKGPFTRTRRRDAVERFITATFGTSIQLTPAGVPLVAGGVPLYADPADLSTLYSIRENGAYGKNLISNGGLETDTTGWSAQAYSGAATSISRVTTQSKYGTASLNANVTALGTGSDVGVATPAVGVIPGQVYIASVWVKGPAGATSYLRRFSNLAEQLPSENVTMDGTWKQLRIIWIAAAGETSGAFRVMTPAVSSAWYIDGFQVERYSYERILSGKNKFPWGDAASGGVGWGLSNATVADGSPAHDGQRAINVSFTASPSSFINSIAPLGGMTAGKTYTLSAWVYVTGLAIGTIVRLQINETGGGLPEAFVNSKDALLLPGWNRISVTGTLTANARSIAPYFVNLSSSTAYTVTLDSVQVEEGAVATAYESPVLASNFVNAQKTPFYYEVRIKNTITPDLVGLIRELSRMTPAGISFDVLSVADV